MTGESLRGAAAERGPDWMRYFELIWGYACGSYWYWFWIIIAILLGLLISVDMRLHNLLKHIPKKVLKELYAKGSKKVFGDYFKKKKRK
ncbi:MAG: hypothetical protein U0519_00915 [Candidatus Gracilibacteria bacterium]